MATEPQHACSTGALITIIVAQLASGVKMRVTACGAYSRAAPVPKMPAGLVELIEGLTKDVLKNNPTNIYKFCAQHLEKLLEIRDGQTPEKKSLEERISKAQEKVRQRAKERQKRYGMEMQYYESHEGPEYANVSEHAQNPSDQQIIPNLKAPIHQDQELANFSEVEISNELSNNSITSKDFDESDKFPISKSSTVSSVSKITVIDLGNDLDANNKVDFDDEIDVSKNESDNTDTIITSAIVDDQRAQMIESISNNKEQYIIESLFTIDGQEVVAEDSEIDTDILEHNDTIVENITLNQMETSDDTNELILDNVNLKSLDAVINNVNKEDEQKEIKDNDFTASENVIAKDELTVNNPENTDNNINDPNKNTSSEKVKENDQVAKLEELREDIQVNFNNYSSVVVSDDIQSSVDNINTDLATDNNVVVNIARDSDSKESSVQVEAEISSEPSNQSEPIPKFEVKTHSTIDLSDQIITKSETENSIEVAATDDKNNQKNIENCTANQNYDNVEKVDLYDESSKDCKDNKNNNNFKDIYDENQIKQFKNNNNSEDKQEFLVRKEIAKDDIESTNSISVPSAENDDSRIIESLSKTEDDLSQNKNPQNNMDLETAAVTIQKVFRSFLFKSRNSTFEDITNDDDATELEEDNDKKEEYYAAAAAAANLGKERRPLGRMDTVLQTVNEEKSLSLSTDDSSTLSSAATTIQAHVRGFLVRNRLNSYKTVSTNSLVNSNELLDTDAEQKNKTVLNIHIVPEEGNYLSRDESFLTSMDLSLDGSPPSSVNLHPLTYDLVSERRKLLKREDAIQSVSPPSNNSGKLSEDSVKEVLINENATPNTEINEKEDDPNQSTNSASETLETAVTAVNVIEIVDDTERRERSISSDESDVITPFTASPRSLIGDFENNSKLIHSGEFHDVVLPTKVSRSDTTVVREFKNVLAYFLLWDTSYTY